MMFIVKYCIKEARLPNVTLNEKGIATSNETGVRDNLAELIREMFDDKSIDIIIKRHEN